MRNPAVAGSNDAWSPRTRRLARVHALMQHLLKLQVLVQNFEELIFGILSTSVARAAFRVAGSVRRRTEVPHLGGIHAGPRGRPASVVCHGHRSKVRSRVRSTRRSAQFSTV